MNATIAAGIITVIAVILYLVLTFRVGLARGKYKVPAPHTDGPEEFQRVMRVQQNTTEQMVAFLPALWVFATFLPNPILIGLLGGLWLVGRILYAAGYYKEARKRMPGFLIAMLATSLLLGGSILGILRALF